MAYDKRSELGEKCVHGMTQTTAVCILAGFALSGHRALDKSVQSI